MSALEIVKFLNGSSSLMATRCCGRLDRQYEISSSRKRTVHFGMATIGSRWTHVSKALPFTPREAFVRTWGQNRARERVSPPDLYRSRWGAAPRAIGTLSRGETTLVKKLTLTVTKLPYKSAFYEKGPPLSEHDPPPAYYIFQSRKLEEIHIFMEISLTEKTL